MNKEEINHFLAAQIKAWETGDVATIVQTFASDGCFLAPGMAKMGSVQIEEAARDYFSQFTKINIEIRCVWHEANRVAVEWDWSDTEKATGKRLTTREAVMIDFNDNGYVQEWREYFNRDKTTPTVEEARGGIKR